MECNRIIRGKVAYNIYPNQVVVEVGSQRISYNRYHEPNRAGLTQFRETILKSKPGQYTTASDFLGLASSCGLRGTSVAQRGSIK